MKSSLIGFMLLTFLQSNGQNISTKAIVSQFTGTVRPEDPEALKSARLATNEWLDSMRDSGTPVRLGIKFVEAPPKYDTIRVLIAYADTSSNRVIWMMRGKAIKDTTYYEKDYNIKWSFVYSVREKGVPLNRCFGCSELVPRHIKYLTEDKKPIPESWVIFISYTAKK